ncbi:hypothetical protein JP0151_10510 [Helicobacter pylori]
MLLHSIKLDLMQKGFDDFSDASFNKIESLKKEFSEQERSKRENLAQLNQVINLFKKSIDKVFDRVSAFTWEKYKEENDDEENYQEFEEIREMILFFRDFQEFSIQNNYSLSQEEIQDYSERIVRHNNMLQLRNSPENFYEFRRFKEVNEKDYENLLNNEKLQKKLREWRRTKRR